MAWICDDAFISFRYAENLVHGLGLVFNAGERVEGYSNLLWTLWAALGIRLGFDPEAWSVAWGIAFYAGSILLLGLRSLQRARASGGSSIVVPLAALLAAVHADWNVYATSGLETSLFTFLAVLGFVVVAGGTARPSRLGWGGFIFGVAALTRPDGVLLAVAVGLFVLVTGRARPWPAVAFGAGFLAVSLPLIAWRLWYYGDFFPNPYYAKSAALAWYSQGWTYTRLFFSKYWVLAVGTVAAAVLAALPARTRRGKPTGPAMGWRTEALLALSLALPYTFYVVRVGGDFMFARLLIPVTPFYLILTELAVLRLVPKGTFAKFAAAAGLLLGVACTPYPFSGEGWVDGIVNERLYYAPEKCRELRRRGEVMARYLRGLPVRAVFMGADTRVIYYSKVPVAIECSTGLTDRAIARQPLTERGRIGHEKRPTAAYLLDERKVNFGLDPIVVPALALADSISPLEVDLDGEVACVLRWEPALMAELARRGARFADVPTALDRYIARAGSLPDSIVRRDYAMFRCFYFNNVADPERLAAFESLVRDQQ